MCTHYIFEFSSTKCQTKTQIYEYVTFFTLDKTSPKQKSLNNYDIDFHVDRFHTP